MTTLADAPELIGFFSYSRDDDEDSENALSKLRLRIQNELRAQLGRSRHTLRLWQDAEAIAPGTLWEAQIDAAVTQSSFFIPIITPRVVASQYCGFELRKFIDREKALGRSDLVFPILHIGVAELTDERLWRNHAVLRVVGERQYVDWREFRYDPDSVAARRAIAGFCSNISATLRTAISSIDSKTTDQSRTKTDKFAPASSFADEQCLADSNDVGEQISNSNIFTPDGFIKYHLQILTSKVMDADAKMKYLFTLSIVAVINGLFVFNLQRLQSLIPHDISLYIPGLYFGLILCFINKHTINKWIAWILVVLCAIIGWYLAIYVTIYYLGDVMKIVPEDYFRSIIAGAIGSFVGISCCLVGLCVGNRRLANLRCISTLVLTAVAVGSVLFSLYLRTTKADLQAWNAWALWLLLVGWQSAVVVARSRIGRRTRAAGD